jgi:hypothetical protein
MKTVMTSIGRAKAALTFGQGQSTKGIISTVVASTRSRIDNERVRFAGAATFDRTIVGHIADSLVPTVDGILNVLDLPKKDFVLSVVNPGAASASDLGVEISGFSADAPTFLALLSAALSMPIPDDTVCTGHIASCDGDLSAVKAIPAKIAAALDDKSIRHFIYPAPDTDRSLSVLSPAEKENIDIAVINAKGRLRMTAVTDITDLIRAVFGDEAIVTGSLQEGFFTRGHPQRAGDGPIDRSVRFLTENNNRRFWSSLGQFFLEGECGRAKELLATRVRFHIRSETYPSEFGRSLIQLLRSLPPVTRRLKLDFPLLPMLECVALTQFAAESDAHDIRLLYEAVEGQSIWIEPVVLRSSSHDADSLNDQKDETIADSIISQIDRIALAKKVAMPIDTARATYVLNTLTTGSSEDFYGIVVAFYLHLQRHVHSTSDSVDMETVRAEATALLERTFAQRGGLKAAMNEAADGLSGGMKFILDAMTEQFKAECMSKHVNRVIKEAITPVDTDEQISLISVLLKRLAPHLPQEIATSPPERFITHYETLVKAYVQSLDKMNEIFRRF